MSTLQELIDLANTPAATSRRAIKKARKTVKRFLKLEAEIDSFQMLCTHHGLAEKYKPQIQHWREMIALAKQLKAKLASAAL